MCSEINDKLLLSQCSIGYNSVGDRRDDIVPTGKNLLIL